MMNDSAGFFDQYGGGGGGAPSFYFNEVGATIRGKVVSIRQMEQLDFSTKEPIPDPKRPGMNKQMLQMVLQTKLRNWDGVKKTPVDLDGVAQPASDDDGTRAVYVKGMMIGAVTDAIRKSGTSKLQIEVGADIAIKFNAEKESGKGNPTKLFVARYEPPAPGADLFADEARRADAETAQRQAEAPSFDDEDDDEIPF